MLRFPDRIHKRPFIVSMLVLTFILVVSGALLLVLRMFGTSNDFPVVTLSNAQSEMLVRDIGINLDHLPSSNLLGNPSFEARQYDAIFTVADSDANSIFVSPEETMKTPVYDGFFSGGTARVLSVDESGILTTKLESAITDYSMNQLGMWTDLQRPADIPTDFQIISSASSSALTIGVGTNGIILADMTSAEPRIVDTGIEEDYIAVSASANRFCAFSRSGDFSCSLDGVNFTTQSPEPRITGSMYTGTIYGKILVAAGEYGRILVCCDDEIREIDSGSRSSFRDSACDGNVILLAGDNGVLRASANGLFFRELSAAELPSGFELTDWISVDTLDGRFLLCSQDGTVAVGTYDDISDEFSFSMYSASDETGKLIQANQAILLPSGEVLLLSATGELYCSDLTFALWKKLSTEMTDKIENIDVLPSGKILLTQGKTAKLTRLYTQISIDNPRSEISLRTGDTCLLSVKMPSVLQDTGEGLWQIGGEHSIMSVQESAPVNGGNYSLRLTGDKKSSSEDAHFISQEIQETDELIFNEGSIYEIKVWLRQEQITGNQVMAWVSGAAVPVGTTFSDVGAGWRQYNYTFVLPRSMKDATEIRLNIGFIGQGILDIDKIYFGSAKSSETFLNEDIVAAIRASKPGMIRLSNVSLGQMNVSSDAWLHSTGNDIESQTKTDSSWGITSLESSLSLVREVEADPWIVIHSAEDEKDIEQLMGYLCAGPSDPYGKIRANNGTPVPWSMQFDRFVFEISDTDQIFQSDTEKSAYVNYIISLISASPYYLDIQDKVLFLDGMEYASKKMVSLADNHTCDISVINYDYEQDLLLDFDAAVTSAYSMYFDQIPRVPFSEQSVAGEKEEWARSTRLTLLSDTGTDANQSYLFQSISAADYSAVILADLGKHTTSLMFDFTAEAPQIDPFSGSIIKSTDLLSEYSVMNRNQQTLLRTIAILGPVSAGYRTDISVSPSTMTELPVEGLLAYAFSEEERTHFIAANTSAIPLTFRLESPWPMDGDECWKYGTDGVLAEASNLSQRNNQITLLPGEILIADITH